MKKKQQIAINEEIETLVIDAFNDIDNVLPDQDAETVKLTNKIMLKLIEDLSQLKPKAEEITKDKDFVEDLLFEVSESKEPLSDRSIECIKYALEKRHYGVIKGSSLAEQYKIEAFIEQMNENPYQLNLLVA